MLIWDRVWYDAAGSTFPRQVQGLLAYGVPTSQLLYGSVSSSATCIRVCNRLQTSFKDFPYAANGASLYSRAISRIENTTLLNEQQKEDLFHGNAGDLFPDAAERIGQKELSGTEK